MTTRARRPAAGILCLAAFSAVSVHDAAAVELRPHRALYDLGLAAARDGSSITALRGEMALEWADACEGWTVSQNIRMDIANRSGASFQNVISFSSYETKSGDRFRFSMKWGAAGDRVEEYVGYAEPGRAVFTVPDGESMPLPEGTMFPTEHMFLLVDAAAAGRSRLTRTVFGGTGPDSLNEVTAFIGAEVPSGTPLATRGDESAVLREVAELRSWPVSMAYFPFESNAPEPDFEAIFRLVENGVAASVILDYGEFAMNAELTEIEFFPPPAC